MKSNSKVILPAIGIAMSLVSPALAAPKHQASTSTPSFEACESLAVERGAGPQQGGNTTNPYIQYNAFMRDCLAGKIPFSAGTGTLGQLK